MHTTEPIKVVANIINAHSQLRSMPISNRGPDRIVYLSIERTTSN